MCSGGDGGTLPGLCYLAHYELVGEGAVHEWGTNARMRDLAVE